MAKDAGAGRGYVNPQRTDEPDNEYVTPKQRYDIDKDRIMANEQKAAEKSYTAARTTFKKGGMASPSKRADGIISKGHTDCKMCGGGYTK
jgi:hypothetical protein